MFMNFKNIDTKESIKDSLKNKASEEWESKEDRDDYDEYLRAMKRVHRSSQAKEMMSPRERYRRQSREGEQAVQTSRDLLQATRIGTISSMLPDEVICNNLNDYTIRNYDVALMFVDVSGFTELCERYTRTGRGGPSKLTQVLNSYIGSIVQEILTHNGDVLKFSGDAFLSMWKKTPKLTMQNVVHTAIDCGLIIQKNYGKYATDVGIVLKVKVAISAGTCYFSLIGDDNFSTYVIVGQPVWDVKDAEYRSSAGDVITSASVWLYINEAEYCTEPCGDGSHTKVLGVGVTWKRVERIGFAIQEHGQTDDPSITLSTSFEDNMKMHYREFALRPSVISALRSWWWPFMRRFVLTPVLRAVDNGEPMDFLTEVRHVVVVFLNVVTRSVSEHVLIRILNDAIKIVYSVTSENYGLVNKVSMFDKDLMFLMVFGLRGLKHEREAQKALLCAQQLRQELVDDNISTVSIGVTCGRTYCGVVGHALRREYTVIGSAVNKAARLMIAYPQKVTCDKETFVLSKLTAESFRLVPALPLKGIAQPGPIYEFNTDGWSDTTTRRHPLLGRNNEVRRLKQLLLAALASAADTRAPRRPGIAIKGVKLAGKTRLMTEFINIIPHYIQVDKIVLIEEHDEIAPFRVFRTIMAKIFSDSGSPKSLRDIMESRILLSLGKMPLTPLLIHAANTIFDCRFPLPERFEHRGDLIAEPCVKNLVHELCKSSSGTLHVVAVNEAGYMDDESWRMLIILLDSGSVFMILTISVDDVPLSATAKHCMEGSHMVEMNVGGINRQYHGALACQLLDVQAIPADLEKVIESASAGLPGWVQNFLISLTARGVLRVRRVPRGAALEAGAALPAPAMLQRVADAAGHVDEDGMSTKSSDYITMSETDIIQMAVLPESYTFDDIHINMTMDVIILKTYDSLTPFENMLLKCGAVLGDNFSRRMLLHLLQNYSARDVSQAVARLFTIRVLECEGGDFTRDTSNVVVHHPAPVMLHTPPPHCRCLGIRRPPECKDLPPYAFCGYMKFRHSLFRTTTYELLTENQKHDLHSRASLYLERHARRCNDCGAGCFSLLFGVSCDNGLVPERDEKRRVREQICALSAETRLTNEAISQRTPRVLDSIHTDILKTATERAYETLSPEEREHLGVDQKFAKRVRSFSSLELGTCECMTILVSVYSKALDHFKAIGKCDMVFETYMEYADLSLINLNIAQALQLVLQAEEFVKAQTICKDQLCKVKWMKSYRLARVLTLRASCMLESGDVGQAQSNLMRAMKLYSDPYPTSKTAVKLRSMKATFSQRMALIFPRLYEATECKGMTGKFYEDVAKTLSQLYKLFTMKKDYENAELAAKWALRYAMKTNYTFRLLCVCYANMIQVYRVQRKFSLCQKLEKKAMDICNRKRGQLDVVEVYAVCSLYTNIFLFCMEDGRKTESLEFGLSVIPLMTIFSDLSTCQMLVMWLLRVLLSDVRIHEMVMIMREFFCLTDYYDLSSETWYYAYAIVILLDTGYSVESYADCERFYIKKGDAITRSKTPEAAWNFFVCMWLVTIRIGAWERAVLWEEKFSPILQNVCDKNEFMTMMRIRLVEGYLITLVTEINNRNVEKIVYLQKNVKMILKQIELGCRSAHMHRPRYLLLLAYFMYLKGKKTVAHKYLGKASEESKRWAHITLQICIEHTKNHWNNTLPAKQVNYWAEHVEADNILDYRDFDPEKYGIVPYTLPLPKDA